MWYLTKSWLLEGGANHVVTGTQSLSVDYCWVGALSENKIEVKFKRPG